jgi:2,3-diketo-5-methylthio-1-phosphopentane phosphatase
MPVFISIDFDGTITEVDITDAIIQEFAASGWEAAEDLWEKGLIGSKECLARQMDLVNAPLDTLLDFVGKFSIRRGFRDFVGLLEDHDIPFAILSDGFAVFIERILLNAGLKGMPVYAGKLGRGKGTVRTAFPFSSLDCLSGTCKCKVARDLSGGLPIVHIGDGRSDFCLAEKAELVFARGRLADFCGGNRVPYISFETFRDIENHLPACSLVSSAAAGDFSKFLRGRQ